VVKLKIFSQICLVVFAIAIVVFVGGWLVNRDWLWLIVFVPFTATVAFLFVVGWLLKQVDRHESSFERRNH
jgi:hypothetical protein